MLQLIDVLRLVTWGLQLALRRLADVVEFRKSGPRAPLGPWHPRRTFPDTWPAFGRVRPACLPTVLFPRRGGHVRPRARALYALEIGTKLFWISEDSENRSPHSGLQP